MIFRVRCTSWCALILLALLPACSPAARRGVDGGEGAANVSTAARAEKLPPRKIEVIPDHEVHSRLGTDCARCHSNSDSAAGMRTPDGAPSAPFDLWQGTMMANSARDPLWRAMVSWEKSLRPAIATEIEGECMTCHAPAATADRRQHGGTLSFADFESERLGEVALDGANCTTCHAIDPQGLGTEESFSGGWVIDHSQRAYGPHDVPFPAPMRPFTGWTPTESPHILESALCGTCHTLFTHTLDLDGEPTGSVFPEQAPYLEWRVSSFSTEDETEGGVSCQGCHLPTRDVDGVEIETRIARTPMGRDFGRLSPRKPFGQHFLVGGNTLIPEILADHREEFEVPAPAEVLRAVAERAREQLAERTAALGIEDVRWVRREGVAEEALEFRVDAFSFAGHKVPTGHPMRRMWLSLRVTDSTGQVLFISGQHDRMGRILDAQGRPLASEERGGPTAPWPDVMRAATDVPIFEMVMNGEDGAPTFSLLSAAKVRKDTRLLPTGWDAPRAEAAGIAPVGVPFGETFTGGRASVRASLPIDRSRVSGTVMVEATLYYQTLGARFRTELAVADTPEMNRFMEILEGRGNPPEVVDRVSVVVP